jgi:hypothetical protein
MFYSISRNNPTARKDLLAEMINPVIDYSCRSKIYELPNTRKKKPRRHCIQRSQAKEVEGLGPRKS